MKSEHSNELQLDRIHNELQHAAIAHTIFHYKSVTSTMPLAHELAKDPKIRSGTVVIAEEQIAGRGRLDRQWQAPAGSSLLMSLLLRDEDLSAHPSHLMMLAGVAVLEGINTIMPALWGKSGLKWPNDIILGNTRTDFFKTGGILIESQLTGSQLSHAVVGIGLNVNQSKEELPQLPTGAVLATSLSEFTGKLWDRTALFIAIAKAWARLAAEQANGQSSIVQQWRKQLWTIGQEVMITSPSSDHRVQLSGQTLRPAARYGTAFDVADDGALLIRGEAGEIHTIHAGDVSLRVASNR